MGWVSLGLWILVVHICSVNAGVTIDTVKAGDGINFPVTGKVHIIAFRNESLQKIECSIHTPFGLFRRSQFIT